MPVKIPIRCRRPWIVLAGIIMLVGVVFQLDEAFPQTAGKTKIGLPDFSISFLSVKIAQSQGLFVRPRDSTPSSFGSATRLR